MNTHLEITLPTVELASFCRHHGIRYLALFGSHLHGDSRIDSDVDLLVEFEPEQRTGMFGITQMEIDLSELLGRPVDLRTAQDLSIYFRDTVLAEAHVLYESQS